MTAVVSGVLFAANVRSAAQTVPGDVDEDYDLNISETRISEAAFHRSLEAGLESNKVILRVGVSADAERIEVTIRGATGHVRFRAALDPLRQRLARLRSELNGR